MLARLSPNLQGIFYMVLAMFGFTINDLFVKYVGQSLPIFEIIAIRGLFICAFLLIWLLIVKARNKAPAVPAAQRRPLIFLRALMEVLATITFLIALVRIPFADVSAVMQSLPLVVTFGAAIFLGEAVGWRRWAAILVGFIGVLIIIRPGYEGFQPATLLVVLSVLFAAARDLITKVLPSDVHSYWVTVATAIAVAGFGLSSTTVLGQWEPVTIGSVLLIFGASSFLIVGYLSIIQAMRIGEVASVTPFRYTSLLWAILFGFLVFSEIPDKLTVIGSLIVVSTGLFAWYRERRAAKLIQ